MIPAASRQVILQSIAQESGGENPGKSKTLPMKADTDAMTRRAVLASVAGVFFRPKCTGQRSELQEIFAYGEAHARALGLKEEDVDHIIHEYRQEQQGRDTSMPD